MVCSSRDNFAKDAGNRREKERLRAADTRSANVVGSRVRNPGTYPESVRACQVDSVADAALQAKLRLRMRNMLNPDKIAAIRCILFRREVWNTQMTAPSRVLETRSAATDNALDQFEIAMAVLAPPSPRKNSKGEHFWPRSYARPFIAENLASGRPWYGGFTQLMTARDETGRNPGPSVRH